MRPAQGLRSLPRGGGGGHKNKRPISKTGHGRRGRGVLAVGAGGGARSLRGGGGKGLGRRASRRAATREHGHGGSASRSGLCRLLSSEITGGRQCHQDGGRVPALRRVASPVCPSRKPTAQPATRPGGSTGTVSFVLAGVHRPGPRTLYHREGRRPGATLCREQRCSACCPFKRALALPSRPLFRPATLFFLLPRFLLVRQVKRPLLVGCSPRPAPPAG